MRPMRAAKIAWISIEKRILDKLLILMHYFTDTLAVT
jgi:hypothetical protein